DDEAEAVFCDGLLVENCFFRETQARVIWSWVTKNLNIRNNRFLDGCGGARPVIRILHACHNAVIRDNVIEVSNNRKTGSNHEQAIVILLNGGTHYRKNILISGNIIQ